jgi:phospholipase/carboxylesterase
MNHANTPPIEVTTSEESVSASVIWLHGLGADGRDFEGIVPTLDLPSATGVRFIFPHAPVQPVTINAGMRMRAWYDIAGIGAEYPQDEPGIRAAEATLRSLIAREQERGVQSDRTVLAGFSQGGAVALHTALRYPRRLAGILALSTYLPLSDRLEQERAPANRGLPIFMAHGDGDSIVPLQFAESSRARLHQLGYSVDWHTYPMAHAVCAEELEHIRDWLCRVLEL